MGINLDSYLGIHANAMMLRDKRSSQLANNLANVNTPNYKARDINFNDTLQQALEGSSTKMAVSNPGHLGGSDDFTTQLKYRVPTYASMDGNTVDRDVETVEFARNALSYQASLSFLDGKIKSMLSALKGE